MEPRRGGSGDVTLLNDGKNSGWFQIRWLRPEPSAADAGASRRCFDRVPA
jgi:hypothetical protein